MDDESFLDQLLRKTAGHTNAPGNAEGHILPDDYARLITCFSAIKTLAVRGKAHVALAAICERERRSGGVDDEPATRGILHHFSAALQSKLADVEEQPLLEALSFLAALFTVDWRAASSVFTRDGFQDTMMDALDLFPTSSYMSSIIASLLSLACGHKTCISALSTRCTSWMETTYQHNKDDKLKSTLSVALLKLSQNAETGATAAGGDEASAALANDRQKMYLKSLRDIITRSDVALRDVVDAIEGLAYLSTKPIFKDAIIKDEVLLRKLVSFHKDLPRKASLEVPLGTAPFGLAAIIANLSSYRPRLTEEQSQIERLRRMAQPGASKDAKGRLSETPEDVLDDDEHVRSRGKKLVESGAVVLLVALSKCSDGAATRMTVGKALLGLAEDKDNRGRIIQAGGAKTLMLLIRSSQQTADPKSSIPLAKGNMEFADIMSIQALAKLSITSSPLQVFGPDVNATIDAIKPFACLLLHQSSTLLQKFEALMALTNISSVGPDLADRVAGTEGLLSKTETLLLDDNTMVRRAAAELICNLVSGSEVAFDLFSGNDDLANSSKQNQAKSRLHILIALADVDDEPTRLAASGAIAVLTSSPTACKSICSLELENHRVFPIFKQLIDLSRDEGRNTEPNLGLVHRGVVCVRNVLLNSTDIKSKGQIVEEAVKEGLVDSLGEIIKSSGQLEGGVAEAILRPTAEALQWIMKEGSV